MEISFDYWYMFFVMIGVSTMAMTFGIGGAAFLSPFLLIVLDMDTSIALGIGLFVEIFGFTSGVVGFARAGMIHYPLGLVMVALALPLSIGGVLLGKYIPANILQIIFGIGMLVLAVMMSLPDRQRLKEVTIS